MTVTKPRSITFSTWIALGVALFLIGSWLFVSLGRKETPAPAFHSGESENSLGQPVLEPKVRGDRLSSKDTVQHAPQYANSTALSEESRQWYARHGYYIDVTASPGTVAATHPYQAFDNPTLDQLAEDGDMTAMVILGDRLLGTLDPVRQQRGLELHYEAVLLGSTYSSSALGTDALRQEPSGDPARDVARIRDGLAWHVVTSALGDPSGDYAYGMYLSTRNFDEDFLKTVCIRAEQLQQQIDFERKNRGLGELTRAPFPQRESLIPLGIQPITDCD